MLLFFSSSMESKITYYIWLSCFFGLLQYGKIPQSLFAIHNVEIFKDSILFYRMFLSFDLSDVSSWSDSGYEFLIGK